MKITMCGYDVSISAKHSWQDKKSKRATLELLNYLSILFDEAAENYEKDGFEQGAKKANQYSDELYEICNNNGLYKA